MESFAEGIHDLPAERYDAADGVSATMLNILAASTPLHLRCWLNGQTEREETEALRFGIIAHYAILQGEVYKDRFHVSPEGMKFNTKAGIAWKADHEDKPIVKYDDAMHLIGMVESISRHPFARRLLSTGKPEQSLFVYDDLGNLRKSRLDSLTLGTTLPDIKTVMSASDDYFKRLISRLRYHVRAAFYLDNCNLLNIDKQQFFFIAVEKLPPYAVRCLQLNGDCITWGRKCYQADLQTYRNCVESDEWPGYTNSYEEIALPDYEMKWILELI